MLIFGVASGLGIGLTKKKNRDDAAFSLSAMEPSPWASSYFERWDYWNRLLKLRREDPYCSFIFSIDRFEGTPTYDMFDIKSRENFDMLFYPSLPVEKFNYDQTYASFRLLGRNLETRGECLSPWHYRLGCWLTECSTAAEVVRDERTGLHFNITPLDFNMRDPMAPSLVFRTLRDGENHQDGLRPRLPVDEMQFSILDAEEIPEPVMFMSPGKHVETGSTAEWSPMISTSKDPVRSLFWAFRGRQARTKMAAIDSSCVTRHAYIFDVSQGDHMDTQKRNLACAFEEVLFKGHIPPSAIRQLVDLEEIPMLQDPAVRKYLRKEASHLWRFRIAFRGGPEQALRKLFGLQVPSVDPNRVPVVQRRAIQARFEHPCRICDGWVSFGQYISLSYEAGWVHEDCLVREGHFARRSRRRGGNNLRRQNRWFRAENELSDLETLWSDEPPVILLRDNDNWPYHYPISLSRPSGLRSYAESQTYALLKFCESNYMIGFSAYPKVQLGFCL